MSIKMKCFIGAVLCALTAYAAPQPNILFVMMVTTSLCSPSQASILTSTYAHVHGVRYNETCDPDPDLLQFPQVLQQSGYTTALIGTWHLALSDEPRPGFDSWLSFRGQGVYNNPVLNENGRRFFVEGYTTDILTEKTIDFLEGHQEDPFCVLLWNKATHGPFTPPLRHANAFPDAHLAEPESWSLNYSQKPQWMRRNKIYNPHYKAWVASEGQPVPARIKPQAWVSNMLYHLSYLRCLPSVDEGLGRILDLLEEQGRLDNTIVIFTSDNGFFLGEHRGMGDKRLAYEESMHVPFVIRYPETILSDVRLPGAR